MQTQFPDRMVEMLEHEHFSGPVSQDDRLMAKIVNLVRKANITVSPPAHIRPIIWSQPIDLSARVNVAAAAGAWATAISYTCPPGRYARINSYGVAVQDATYAYDGSLLWRFRVNGQPLGDGMSNWALQRGSIQNPRDTFIILKEDQTIEFQVQRAAAAVAAQDVDHALTGWTWLLRNNYEGTAASVTAF